MKIVAQYEEYAGNNPILKTFGTVAHANSARDVVISGHVAVVPGVESFAETLTTKASSTQSDFMVVPWSETGSLSELPSYLVGGGHRDPLANREFSRLAEDLFESAKRISSIGVLIDGTLLKSANSKSSHGISSAVSTHKANTVTFTSSASGKTHIHVLYAFTADDLFAVKLALQLAQKQAVVLMITKLAAAASVSQEDADVYDASF